MVESCVSSKHLLCYSSRGILELSSSIFLFWVILSVYVGASCFREGDE